MHKSLRAIVVMCVGLLPLFPSSVHAEVAECSIVFDDASGYGDLPLSEDTPSAVVGLRSLESINGPVSVATIDGQTGVGRMGGIAVRASQPGVPFTRLSFAVMKGSGCVPESVVVSSELVNTSSNGMKVTAKVIESVSDCVVSSNITGQAAPLTFSLTNCDATTDEFELQLDFVAEASGPGSTLGFRIDLSKVEVAS